MKSIRKGNYVAQFQNIVGDFKGWTVNGTFYRWPFIPKELCHKKIKRIVLEDNNVFLTTED